jgi:hypothetical protein
MNWREEQAVYWGKMQRLGIRLANEEELDKQICCSLCKSFYRPNITDPSYQECLRYNEVAGQVGLKKVEIWKTWVCDEYEYR